MVLDPIPKSLPVHFFGSRPQPPTSPLVVFIVYHAFWAALKYTFSVRPEVHVHVHVCVYVSSVIRLFCAHLKCDKTILCTLLVTAAYFDVPSSHCTLHSVIQQRGKTRACACVCICVTAAYFDVPSSRENLFICMWKSFRLSEVRCTGAADLGFA